MMAARYEIIMVDGLLCMKFDTQHWLRTMELWTSEVQRRRGLHQMQTKANKGERGVENTVYIFADVLHEWPLITQ